MTIVNRYISTQDTTNTYAVVENFLIQTTYGKSVAITLKNTRDNSILWTVYGGNLSDMSDYITVKSEATVLGGAGDSYANSFAPFEFYYVYVVNGTTDLSSTVVLNAIVKN